MQGVGGLRNNDIPAQSVPFIPGSTTNDSGMDAGNQMDRKNSGDNTARGCSNMSGGGINRDLSNNSLTGRPGSGEHPPPTMMGDLATAGVSTGDNDNAYKVPPKFGVPHGDITRTVITPTASMTGAVSANANLLYPRQQPHLALRQWAMAIVVVIWCPRLLCRSYRTLQYRNWTEH